MTTHLLSTNDDRWLSVLAEMDHDVYQLPGWALAEECLHSGTASAVVATNGDASCLVPFVRRPIPATQDSWDAISPYGYSGPVWTRGAASSARTALLTEALDRLTADGAVSFFVRLHPVLHEGELLSNFSLPVVEVGPTVLIDLTIGPEQRWQQMRAGHRRDIRRARDRGCAVVLDPELRALEQFADLYRTTMRRIGASDNYLFPSTYFETLHSRIGDHLLLAGVQYGGSVVGGALFTLAPRMGGIGYHLSAAEQLPGNLQPTKLLLHEVSEWGVQNGYEWMHLGGGLGASEDSLFQFKRGFSRATREFRTVRIILDRRKYQALSGSVSAHIETGNYFPAYRDPSREEPAP